MQVANGTARPATPRYRREGDQIEIDFPKSDRDAKRKVVAAPDEINPRWRRVFVLYPRD
jgi:hypothetical protein